MPRFPSILVLLCACGFGSTPDDAVVNGLRTWTDSYRSSGQALIEIEIPIQAGESSFIVTAESDYILALEYVYDPDFNLVMDWADWNGQESLTAAVYADETDLVINWPIRPEDGALSTGSWWLDVVTVDGNGSYTSGVDVDITVQVKEDDNLSAGTVYAMLVYAEGLADDAEVVAGTEAAVARWVDIWAGYGLELSVEYYDSDLSAALASPGEGGDSGMLLTSEGGSNHDVTILIGETIDGSTEYYGIAGSIPGTLLATQRSGVVLSWLANAGGDGVFDADDVRLYGETLAHEVGHYMGLFHPVESDYYYYDALDDTAQCSNETDCDSQLGDNLMYPYPVCDWDSCTPQDQLSDGQSGVKHRYTGTL
jgi:hypothetical protein